MAAFAGFAPSAFAWFEGLEQDNSRAYMEATRATYVAEVRGPLEALLQELAAEFGGEAKLFRQHRDTRFSPDKAPYKTQTYGVLAGGPDVLSGYYAELSLDGFYAATGLHVMEPGQLRRYREAVADDRSGPALESAVAAARDAGLEVLGDVLKTAPRGYPRDHPRVALLRHKAVIAGRQLPAGRDGIGRGAALEHAASTWRAAAPVNAWLVEHVGR